MRSWYRPRSLGLLFVIGLVLGCAPAKEASKVGPERVVSYRTQILLPEEPEGAVGILELRARMEGTEVNESPDDHQHAANGGHDADAHDSEQHDLPGEADVVANDEPAEMHDEMHDETANHDHTDDEHADHEHDDHEHAAQESSPPALEFLMDVTVVGKIGKQASQDGVEASEFPWERGVAAFVIVDPAAEGEVVQHEHKEGEECPFCAKKKIEAQAIVQFNDDSHVPIRIDARELFGLKVDDLVVVCGDAKLVGGVLMIDASQLHIRR